MSTTQYPPLKKLTDLVLVRSKKPNANGRKRIWMLFRDTEGTKHRGFHLGRDTDKSFSVCLTKPKRFSQNGIESSGAPTMLIGITDPEDAEKIKKFRQQYLDQWTRLNCFNETKETKDADGNTKSVMYTPADMDTMLDMEKKELTEEDKVLLSDAKREIDEDTPESQKKAIHEAIEQAKERGLWGIHEAKKLLSSYRKKMYENLPNKTSPYLVLPFSVYMKEDKETGEVRELVSVKFNLSDETRYNDREPNGSKTVTLADGTTKEKPVWKMPPIPDGWESIDARDNVSVLANASGDFDTAHTGHSLWTQNVIRVAKGGSGEVKPVTRVALGDDDDEIELDAPTERLDAEGDGGEGQQSLDAVGIYTASATDGAFAGYEDDPSVRDFSATGFGTMPTESLADETHTTGFGVDRKSRKRGRKDKDKDPTGGGHRSKRRVGDDE